MNEPMVNVQPIKAWSWGSCRVRGKKQRCGKPGIWMIFNGDGRPKSSRLDSCCCTEHLPRAIRLAFKENWKDRA